MAASRPAPQRRGDSMNIVVLLAGIADPKWPLPPITLEPMAMRKTAHLAFSPFDEAALETGLQIRDAFPGAVLIIAITGGPESEALLRKAAAYKPARAVRIDATGLHPWEPRAQAAQLAASVQALDGAADLVVIGREFGDYDWGAVAPSLAAALGWGFFGLAQHTKREGKALALLREQGSREETHMVGAPLVVSVTNDRRNRLRHPLMKNVMEAKRMTLEAVIPPPATAALTLDNISPAPPPARAGQGKMLTGPLEVQIEELANYLEGWRAQP